MEKREYAYAGAVLKFNTVVNRNWSASTFATSEKEAVRNLTFRFKKENGFERTAKISLAKTPFRVE